MKNHQVKKLESKSFDVSVEIEGKTAHALLTIEPNGDYTVKCTFKPRHGEAFNNVKESALLEAIKVGKNQSLNV